MNDDQPIDRAWSRTHFMDKPEKRMSLDRRKTNYFISNDRRSGIACRRREKQLEIERKIALSKVKFYPDYYRVT